MNLLIKENKVPAILVFNIAFFFILFLIDINTREGFGNRKAIGTLVFKKNQVHRKFDSQVVWSVIDSNGFLSNKDSIRTEALSDATIKLNDGTEIQINENSMVFLDLSGFGGTTLDFKEGSFKVTRSKDSSFFRSNLTIKSKDGSVEVGNSDVHVEKTAKQNLSVFVEKGTATVIQENGKSRKIQEHEQAELAAKGEISVKKVPLKLSIPPDQHRIISLVNSSAVNFEWQNTPHHSSYKIQVSRRPDFSSILHSVSVNGNKTQLPLIDGTYYWRVVSVNSQSGREDSSETRKLVVLKNSAPVPHSPEEGSTITVGKEKSEVEFDWSKADLAQKYKLEISESPEFSGKIIVKDADSHMISVRDLKPGNYFWRVTGSSGLADIPDRKSRAQRFSVVASTDEQRVKTDTELKAAGTPDPKSQPDPGLKSQLKEVPKGHVTGKEPEKTPQNKSNTPDKMLTPEEWKRIEDQKRADAEKNKFQEKRKSQEERIKDEQKRFQEFLKL
ncbi:MAG: FecR domain-containing protein [Leptospira sp.]|nr:FecR domain-containing protein [Leptospira sp.]